MSRRKKEYFTGTFIITKEHLEISLLAGRAKYELINEYLTGIEMDNLLKPGSLNVYYVETHKDYTEYFFTDVNNKEYIQSFLVKAFNMNYQGDPILN